MKHLGRLSVLLISVVSAAQQWQPRPGLTWNYQIGSTPTDLAVHVQVYDIDGFGNESTQVAAIHSTGASVSNTANARPCCRLSMPEKRFLKSNTGVSRASSVPKPTR